MSPRGYPSLTSSDAVRLCQQAMKRAFSTLSASADTITFSGGTASMRISRTVTF